MMATLAIVGAIVAVLTLVITVGVMVSNVNYRSGQNDARLVALELWRTDMRKDMHEISDKLQTISVQLSGLATLLQERTERRAMPRITDPRDG